MEPENKREDFAVQSRTFQQTGGQMLHRVERAPVKVKRLGQAMWDGIAWIIATPIAFMLRYDFSATHPLSEQVWLLALALALTQIVLGFAFDPPDEILSYPKEVRGVVRSIHLARLTLADLFDWWRLVVKFVGNFVVIPFVNRS